MRETTACQVDMGVLSALLLLSAHSASHARDLREPAATSGPSRATLLMPPPSSVEGFTNAEIETAGWRDRYHLSMARSFAVRSGLSGIMHEGSQLDDPSYTRMNCLFISEHFGASKN